jgi:hypothetical protein
MNKYYKPLFSTSRWDQEETKTLKENYSDKGPKQLQELLPSRSIKSIQAKALLMKLKKSRGVRRLIGQRAVNRRWGKK